MQKEKQPNIGIVTFPVGESGIIPLGHLVDVVSPITSNLYLISGNAASSLFKHDHRVYFEGVDHHSGSNTVTRVLRYTLTQLRISYEVAQISGKVDIFIFFIGGHHLLLPMLTSKLLGKKVILAMAGFATQGIKFESNTIEIPIRLIDKINLSLSDKIILYTERLVEEYGFQKYRHKISIAHRHFLDFSKFKVEKPLEKRENLIGYIGRLSEEKGILNFIEAIPKALEREDSVEILIGGDGQLRGKVERYLNQQNLNNKVKFVGWIPHDELPDYLNKLKLLVLPSHAEGLPNIILEAMACGTPVLATTVGAIPDVIKEGETGFIMEDNSPDCIARNIIRALSHPNLEEIVNNARALVEKEYTYEKAVERYRKILASLK